MDPVHPSFNLMNVFANRQKTRINQRPVEEPGKNLQLENKFISEVNQIKEIKAEAKQDFKEVAISLGITVNELKEKINSGDIVVTPKGIFSRDKDKVAARKLRRALHAEEVAQRRENDAINKNIEMEAYCRLYPNTVACQQYAIIKGK